MAHSERFLKICDDAKTRIKEITMDDYRNRYKSDKPLVIDVREENEFQTARIPGAVWLGKGILERDIEEAYRNLDTEMVLYCGGGFRSALAADNLQKMGYTNVLSLAGGFRLWKENGFEIEV